MENLVLVSAGLALATFFVWRAIARILDEIKCQRTAEQIEQTKKDLNHAIETGNVARVVLLKRRLQELLSA